MILSHSTPLCLTLVFKVRFPVLLRRQQCCWVPCDNVGVYSLCVGFRCIVVVPIHTGLCWCCWLRSSLMCCTLLTAGYVQFSANVDVSLVRSPMVCRSKVAVYIGFFCHSIVVWADRDSRGIWLLPIPMILDCLSWIFSAVPYCQVVSLIEIRFQRERGSRTGQLLQSAQYSTNNRVFVVFNSAEREALSCRKKGDERKFRRWVRNCLQTVGCWSFQ